MTEIKAKKPNTRTITFGPEYREVEVGNIEYICQDKPLKMKCGAEIKNFPVAYQMFGELNEAKSNAILICHALTGDQYVIGPHPVTGKPGWWENYVGVGKPIDTSKYCIICINVLGSCLGTFGPKDINEKTGEPYRLDFPIVTIDDMVNVQKLLIDKLGIKKLAYIIGTSMGGMCSLEWLSKYPDSFAGLIAISTSAKHSAQNIAFNEVGRQSVMADDDWYQGEYSKHKKYPSKGLAVARMMAHITYLSESGLQHKFGRNLQDKKSFSYGFDIDFQIESYLRHQGKSFVERFDPNSYLYVTRAMDYFDLESDHGSLSKAWENANCRCLVISCSSDWLFDTEDAKNIVRGLSGTNCEVSFLELQNDSGHDAFLLPNKSLEKTLKGFLKEDF